MEEKTAPKKHGQSYIENAAWGNHQQSLYR
jgi:hypothetical protein